MPLPDVPQNQTPSLWRGRYKHIRKYARTLVPRRVATVRTVERRSVDWMLPWGMDDYPGKAKGMAQLVPRASLHTVQAWLKGNRRAPGWAREAIAAYIEERCRVGLALVAELRESGPERSARGTGFARLDPVTGMDRRPKSGRRTVKEV